MNSINDHFKHESLEDVESIINYLSALKEGFETGALRFSSDDQILILKPQGLVNMDVDVRRKGDEVRLAVRLRWNEGIAPKKPQNRSLQIKPLTEE
ncbi:MAG: amphi-Trp domain-containing protein [Deltaproteobacteria bacterium]|nr:amphi-Trp domain-containing protein [Deltaproteobacteria bacterium]